MVTFALGTTAPDESVTVPAIEPVTSCVQAGMASAMSKDTITASFINRMLPPKTNCNQKMPLANGPRKKR
jgi:hypothetical protein